MPETPGPMAGRFAFQGAGPLKRGGVRHSCRSQAVRPFHLAARALMCAAGTSCALAGCRQDVSGVSVHKPWVLGLALTGHDSNGDGAYAGEPPDWRDGTAVPDGSTQHRG